jgi:lipopolysaccharide cholinephosphotransferase
MKSIAMRESMSFEDYYLKIPDFIKFNPRILKFSFDFADRIKQRSGVSTEDYLSDLANRDPEIKIIHNKFQRLYVEILIFIDKVCEKYDIDYWLGYGTLLGAVRHGGFIPWDDDIDLVILREDYNRLIEVLPKELVEHDLKQHCGLTLLLENRKNYFTDFASVYDAKDKNGENLVYGKYNFLQIAWLKPYVKIDFFPLDFIEDGRVEEVNDKYAQVSYKFYNDLLNDNVKFSKFDEVRKNVGFTDSKTKQFGEGIDTVPHWRISIFDYDKTFPLMSIEFEGHEFKCPKDYDHHLISMYGPDYMEFPDIIENHNTLDLIGRQFGSMDEMNRAFDEAIDFLKNVNENF